jgi:alpha-beta hydrolase superfamily lysophospholipase
LRHEEGSIDGTAGARLFRQSWLPDGPPAGVLVIVHGLAEHSGRYDELVRRLVDQRYAVHALDHRGHGRSSGRRAMIDRFKFLVDDLACLIADVRKQHGDARIVLLGHSMGGAIALDYALAHADALSALVLSAPAIGADPGVPRWRIAMARGLSAILPNVGAIKLPAAAISRDPDVVRDYENDPLVFRGAVPARTATELLEAMTALSTRTAQLRVPVLVLHGTADALVPLAIAEPAYAGLGSADRTVRRYPGLYHEVFHEPERAQVFADLEDWLRAHC